MLPISERRFQQAGKTFTHYFVDSAPVACIIARNAEGRFLLVRQYRAPLDKKIIEFPAGKIDPGEEAIAGARRELEEETGYLAGTLRPVFRFFTTPGYSTEEIHVFYAENLQPTQTNFDEGEDLETLFWSEDELEKAIERGEIFDGKTILAFWAWQRFGS